LCGLVGVAGRINKPENDVFRDLLMVDVLRGPHSTGIACLPRNAEGKVFKKAVLPQDLFQMKGVDQFFNNYGFHKLLLGHNRWATVGKVNSVNAHPFELDHLIGAHNGTLRNQSLLPNHLQFETDSENIFHAFETLGVEATVRKLHGAFALTWFDKAGKVLNLLRNDERPLFFTFFNKDKTFAYASERWMLEGILARHGLAHSDIQSLEPMYHYTLEIPDNENTAFDNFHMKKLEGYTPPKYDGNRWKGQQTNGVQGGKGISKPNTAKSKAPQNLNSMSGTDGGTSDLKKQSTNSGGSTDGTHKTFKRQTGDYVAFRILAATVDRDARSVYGRDVFNPDTKYRVYLPKGSKLRKQMRENPQEWWAGIVNTADKNGFYVIQGNSVELYDDLDADKFDKLQADNVEAEMRIRREQLELLQEEDAEALRNAEEWDSHVSMIAAVGRCGWCDEVLSPLADNLVANSQAIFCPSCKALPELKPFLPEK
jgi:hypothetical protein